MAILCTIFQIVVLKKIKVPIWRNEIPDKSITFASAITS